MKIIQENLGQALSTKAVAKLLGLDVKPADTMAYIIKQKEDRSGYAANKDRKTL